MAELTGKPGFAPPPAKRTPTTRSAVALELIATVALTASLVVAATAVSMGNRSLARNDARALHPLQMRPGAPADHTGNRLR